MKIVAEVYRLPSGSLIPQLFCQSESGEIVREVTDTLLDLVVESLPSQLDQIVQLLDLAIKGTYSRKDRMLADWSVNDKLVWIGPPRSEVGFIVVSNENIPEFSDVDGQPQRFSIKQFFDVMAHWGKFQEMLVENGKAAYVGHRFEADI
ncbi:hypothetical protein [Burkholderia plantarii]|uniref:hypothetical protein n=1 Tax=Burkholderia plantarii TaxID=41899 RepID=UPI000F4FF518|nr:hypothetical protein [Burkholderia plantarii]